MPRGNPKTPISLRLDPHLFDTMEAERGDIPRSRFIELCIANRCAQKVGKTETPRYDRC